MKDSHKPKVLLVHNFYQTPGGEDTVYNNEKKLLEDNGHQVITYIRNNEELKDYSLWDKAIYPINSIFSLKTYKEVKKIIANRHIDIVHVHNTWPLISPSVYYAAFHSKIPVVQTVHNFRLICPGATLYYEDKIFEESLHNGLRRAVKNKVYKNSYIQTLISATMLKIHRILGTYQKINFIFLTEFNRQKHLEMNKSKKIIINLKKTYIKPNFVNQNREAIPFLKRKNQFVFAGRLDKSKGIDTLLEAWKKIKNSDLIICGIGPEYDWCEKYILENNLNNVYLMGFVENDKVLDIISESKALILPTKWYEGFPMTIVESISCGTPIIGSDIGNVGNIINDRMTGLKFKKGSSEELIKSVNNFFDMVNNCKNESLKYSSQQNYEELISIYSKIT